MKIPTLKRQHGLQFSMTSLIDIIFLLIIFFLVSSHFVRSETREPVELPEATQETSATELPRRLVITITRDHVLHVNGNVVSLQVIEFMLDSEKDEQQNLEVHIRADKLVPYRVIQPIMRACLRANLRSLRIPVLLK